MRNTLFASCLALLCVSAAHADLYTVIPFQEYAYDRAQVFGFFDNLKSLRAYVVGDDGTFLGEVSRSTWGDSLNNSWRFGDTSRTTSLFNENGPYGSVYSNYSAFNAYALNPPTIRYEQYGVEYVAGYLTKNQYFVGAYQVPNIDPCCLCDWISAMSCAR